MNIFKKSTILHLKLTATAALCSMPGTSHAAENSAFEMGTKEYAVLAGILVFAIFTMIALYRRFRSTRRMLQDLGSELDSTRTRLTETSLNLEQAKHDLKAGNDHHQKILGEARVGIFQIDVIGRCMYVNPALFDLSGLYQKKVAKEGFLSAVHPDDRETYKQAWESFIQGKAPFSLDFRFSFKKGRYPTVVHVHGEASTMLNEKKEPESYICWFTDITHQEQRHKQQETETGRYRFFINETIEGCYRLQCETPIPLNPKTESMADAILEKMAVWDCNSTFSTLYGTTPGELTGKTIGELQGGCGPFKKRQDLIHFIENDFRAVALESVRQDSHGNRVNLVNDVVGIVEDNCLVGIWGTHRNISRQKRETTELTSQVRFMHRILDTLPADVYVKDTRCRYLYASRKLAERTGISQQEWIGKTIFEVIPGTPREHDQSAIETMKSVKLKRSERPYNARGKSGWMESVQIPLISEEGLVEGVIGLSLDISERRQREEEVRQRCSTLESVIQDTRNELSQSRAEYGKAATALADALDKLRVADADKQTREHLFNKQMEERSQIEQSLRRNEENLQQRQQQLEEQLEKRMMQLQKETDKRMKWEELLQLREDELQKVETLAEESRQQLEETESFLKSTQNQLIHITSEHAKELEEQGAAKRETEEKLEDALHQVAAHDAMTKVKIDELTAHHESTFSEEHKARTEAEKQLAKTDRLLQTTQQEIKQQTEQHALELEEEIAERKAAAEKLIQSTQELDTLRKDFYSRINEETKSIKQELAQKQIREKAIRRHEKEMEEQLHQAEEALKQKAREIEQQQQQMEALEIEKNNIEQRLEQVNRRQQEELDQKQIREKTIQRHENEMEEQLHNAKKALEQKTQEIEQQQQQMEALKIEKNNAEERLEQLLRHQQEELNQKQIREKTIQRHETEMKEQLHKAETSLKQKTTEIEAQLQQMGSLEIEKKNTEERLDQLTRQQQELISQETQKLQLQITEIRLNEVKLRKESKDLQHEKDSLKQLLSERSLALEKALQQQHTLEGRLDESKSRAKEEVESLNARIESVQENAEELQKELDQLEQEKAELEKMLEGQNAELKQAEEQKTALTENAGKLTAQLELLEHSETDLQKEADILRRRIEVDYQQINDLRADLKAEVTNRESTESDLHSLQAAIEESREQAEALVQDELKKLRNEITELNSARRTLQQDLEESSKEVTLRDQALESKEKQKRQTEARMAEVEQQLAEIRENQQEQIKQAIAEAQALSILNADVVDDLNRSLQQELEPVIRTNRKLEESPYLQDEEKARVAHATLQCRKLIDTMNYRAELTHLSDGSEAMQNDICDLHKMMTDIDRQFTHRAETKKLFFAVSFAQYQTANNLPRKVETDARKVQKVLTILLGYAMEHTEKGRLGLHAARHSSSDLSTNIRFELAYTGRQAADELLDAVFADEPNDRIDVKYGLTLARRYIDLLGGTLQVEYRAGGLTALSLQLPFKKVFSEISEQDNVSQEAGAA